MKKEITLSKKYGTYDNVSPFILADNEKLEIEITNLIPKGIDCYLTIFNGKQKKKFKYKGCFEMPEELIFVGELLIQIDFLKASEIYEQFSVEPLLIKQIDSEYELIPQIAELKSDIQELREKVEKLTKLTEELTDTLMSLLQRQIGD